MSRNSYDFAGDSGKTAPTAAWLFAQVILGKPIPNVVNPEALAEAKRAELKQLARFSSRHAAELRRIENATATARRERASLEWAAQISTRAQEKLRALQHKEAAERAAWQRVKRFYETYQSGIIEWDETDHPRQPKGTSDGGQWIPKDGGSRSSVGSPPSLLDRATQPSRDSAVDTTEPATTIAASSASLPATWPRLTAAEQAQAGSSWSNPFATMRGLADRVWEKKFENLGRQALADLKEVAQELTKLQALGTPEDLANADSERQAAYDDQYERVRQAYDNYLQSLTQIQKEYTAYNGMGYWYLGPNVAAIYDKLQNALGIIPGIPSDESSNFLRASLQANEAGRQTLGKTDNLILGLQVADWTVTGIEVASGAGALRKGAQKVAELAFRKAAQQAIEQGLKKEVRNQLAEAAARKAAVTFVTTQVGIGAGAQLGATYAIPPLMTKLGVAEHQIRAGLVLFQAINIYRQIPKTKIDVAPGKVAPRNKYQGGRHGQTKGPKGDGLESHHMPADSVNGLPKDRGPAIQMEPADHAKTASHGTQLGSDIYRLKQQRLIKQGRFGEAIQMDVDDIRKNFGNKYDEAIKQMIDQLDPSMKSGLKG